MMNIIKAIILLIFLFVISACEEEYINITEEEEVEEESETIKLVSSTISGSVIDLNENPLINVVVELSIDNLVLAQSLTNSDGEFNLEDVKVNEEKTLLTFYSPIHNNSFKVLKTKEGLVQFTEVLMSESFNSVLEEDQQVSYNDDNITFSIPSEAINNDQNSQVSTKVNSLNVNELKSNSLLPYNGINGKKESVHLNHQMAFQINLTDSNQESITLFPEKTYEVSLNTEIDITAFNIWHFNEKTAQWVLDEALFFKDASTVVLNKLGLFSIAQSNESFILSGTVIDDANNKITASKITIRDEAGIVINQTFSNSLGEYKVQVKRQLAGTIEIIKEGYPRKEIKFGDVSIPELSSIALVSQTDCKNIELSVQPFACSVSFSPEELFDNDASTFSNFVLSLNESTYDVATSSESFPDIDFSSSIAEPFNYTIKYSDASGAEQECSSTIIIKDEVPPAAVCLDKISIKIETNEPTVIFALDIDSGSVDTSCPETLSLLIARADQCNQDCTEENFSETVEFTSADIGKTITAILKVTDNNENTSQCATEITISDK